MGLFIFLFLQALSEYITAISLGLFLLSLIPEFRHLNVQFIVDGIILLFFFVRCLFFSRLIQTLFGRNLRQ